MNNPPTSSLNSNCPFIFIDLFKERLVEVLEEHNFTGLLQMLENKKFHIHTHTINDILSSKPEDVFYICDHC